MRILACYLKRILTGVLCLSFTSASIAAPIPLELYTQEFPPLQIELNGKPEGYVVKFVEAVVADAAKTLPMEISGVHFVPWKRAIRTTQRNSNVLFFSLSRTQSREAQYTWIGQVSPYEVAVYRHISGPSVAIKNLSQLKGFSVAAQPASAFEALIKDIGVENIIPVHYGREAIKLLHAKRVDFAPLTQSSFHYRVEQYGYKPSEFVEVLKVDELSQELWLVTGNKTSPAVVKALMQSFERLKAEGLLEQLMNEYHPKSEVMTRYRNKV
ncbi:substrate-binding periplasmic protein [Vibrio japonicus]|uniref:Transporter substrate-binding domain-containing protein n=1 Tax=Vibrio japonicus TaxID=1824638 RepID=A0ABY5LLU7_9VIBR|nr:transporter substrate-binding domain-containing protein [Vibrio japonicus]UUM33059.1 transporter substrate-binding domain-containing protein [Vibrio japonicus]